MHGISFVICCCCHHLPKFSVSWPSAISPTLSISGNSLKLRDGSGFSSCMKFDSYEIIPKKKSFLFFFFFLSSLDEELRSKTVVSSLVFMKMLLPLLVRNFKLNSANSAITVMQFIYGRICKWRIHLLLPPHIYAASTSGITSFS